MKVEIWSDIRCPFCYIGKRRFEAALDQFKHKDQVEIQWKSFELEPEMRTDTTTNIYEHLAARKGQSLQWSVGAHGQMTAMAKEEGLEFNFDRTVVANSFDAHRLIHFGIENGLGDVTKERLLKAYFTEGKDISDHLTLIQLGAEIGLDGVAVKDMLRSDDYKSEVRLDEMKARTLGIRGVPFFVLNDRFGVSGAQSPEIFLQSLEQAWAESEKELSMAATGDTCSTNGQC
jgi:protein disulfide-isomerase